MDETKKVDKGRSEEDGPQTLSSILFNEKRLEILEVLLDSPDNEFTLRELEERTKVSKPVVLSFVDNLNKLGVVSKRKKGNLYLVSIIEDNRYVDYLKKILELDSQPLVEAARELAGKINRNLNENLIIVLYGSVARGTPMIGSDIDLLIAAKKVENVEKKVKGIIEKEKEKGYSFSPLFMSFKELKDRIESEDGFINRVLKDGEVIVGEEKWCKITGEEL